MSMMPRQGQMPPQYDTRPPAPSPFEALGRRIALLEQRVTELETQLAEQQLEANAKPAPRKTTKSS